MKEFTTSDYLTAKGAKKAKKMLSDYLPQRRKVAKLLGNCIFSDVGDFARLRE
jgi:hypothetical protein